jgi:spore coat polysaccharide biosynthesis protein SpsF (cytidylyltransferase family)
MLELFDDGRSLLEFQLIRLKEAFPFGPIVVATTTEAADQAIEDIALKNDVLIYRGEEQNVLGRFVNCCRHFHFTDYIIRICADNPFLQIEFLRTLMEEAIEGGGQDDYISFSVRRTPAILTHFGFFAEMVKAGALERVNETVTTPYHREHLTSFIYLQENGGTLRENGDFKLRWLEFEALAPFVESVRLTIDSREDFDNGREIYGALKGETAREVGWRSIVSYIDKHPGIREKMEQQIRLHRK